MIDSNQGGGACAGRLRRGVLEGLVVAALVWTPVFASQADETNAPKAEASAATAPAEAEAAPASTAMPCPALTAEKYPFLTCVRGLSGGPVLATVGPGVPGARMKLLSGYVDGPGGWGQSGIE